MIFLPGDEQEETYTGADRGVSNVKCRKTYLTRTSSIDIEVNEVDYMAVNSTVNQVTGDTAADQAQRDLTATRMHIEVVPSQQQDYEGEDGEDGEPHITALELVKEAPGSPPVGPMYEAEEALDYHAFLGGIEPPEDEPFAELICGEDGEGYRGDLPQEA